MNIEIPEFNNFFSYITGVSIKRVVDTFRNSGWSAKSSAWGEWMLYNEWSDFILTGTTSQELLLNGAIIVDKPNIDKLEKTFALIEGEYGCEFYDINNTLLIELKNTKA